MRFYKCDLEKVDLPKDRLHEFCELPMVKLFPRDLDSTPWDYYGTFTDIKDVQEWLDTSVKVSDFQEKRKYNALKSRQMFRTHG